MIDLHCHLHFGVDDGPVDEEQALDLARALVDVGVRAVACTSHVRPDKGWRNTAPGEPERAARLTSLLAKHQVPLSLYRGAEHYIDDEVFGDLQRDPAAFDARVVPYGASRWLLVECPYHGPPPDLLGLLYGVRRRGFRVLLAHVERFPYVCDDDAMLERVLQAGHLVQVNLGSLAGAYDRAHKKAAERLMKAGRVAVLAGDCHRRSDVIDYMKAGMRAAEKLVGPERLRRLLVDNPQKILDDHSPERVWP